MDLTTLGYAFVGGLLPSIIWLYFLLKEDAGHPEPKHLIVYALIAGMLAVPLAFLFERWSCWQFAVNPFLACSGTAGGMASSTFGLGVTISWALIEEVLKYGMAALLILWRRDVDEAPDYVIYLFTTALGFAAAENVLFLSSAITDGGLAQGVFVNNVRFLGSTLLHVVASGALGFALAFTLRKSHVARLSAAAAGLILAVALHTAFNALMMSEDAAMTLNAFFLVWSGAVVFFAAFEVLKYFQYQSPTHPSYLA